MMEQKGKMMEQTTLVLSVTCNGELKKTSWFQDVCNPAGAVRLLVLQQQIAGK